PPRSASGKPERGHFGAATAPWNAHSTPVECEANAHSRIPDWSAPPTPRLEVSRGFRYHSGLEFSGLPRNPVPLSRASRRGQGPVYPPERTGRAVVINEKDVVKNVDAATEGGTHAGATAMPSLRRQTRSGAMRALVLAATMSVAAFAPSASHAKDAAGLGAD